MKIPEPVLNKDELIALLNQHSGLIPTAINAEAGELIWTDMGSYHFYEGFFRKSINIHYILKNSLVDTFKSSLDILEDDRIIKDHIMPQGFIFHAGHCGSTAVAKSLARSRNNLVLSEATPIGQLLSIFKKHPEIPSSKQKQMLRNLILAMCRKRLVTHNRAFIKFSSHNIHFFELLKSIFPDAPALFLRRDKASIVNSFRKRPPGWLKDGLDLEESVQVFLAKASSIPDHILLKFDHNEVNAENLSRILDHFQVHPQQAELELMQSQFKYDSKVDYNLKEFSGRKGVCA